MEFSSEENILLGTVQAGDQRQQQKKKKETNVMQRAVPTVLLREERSH